MTVPLLVAHRGYAREYPENTIESIAAAVDAGACRVEFDIQLTADRVPVLFHDDGLMRTTGQTGSILDLSLAQTRGLHANEHSRLGDRFHGTRVPTLDELIERLAHWPGLHVFVEIKQESLDRFGIDPVLDAVMPRLGPAIERCCVISFAREVMAAARSRGARRCGWVMHRWDEESLRWIDRERPDVVFCNWRKLPPAMTSLPAGSHDWVLYEIDEPELALHWAGCGAAMIETFDVGGMLRDPRLARRRCRHD